MSYISQSWGIYENKALTLLWQFNFCRISFPWTPETGTGKGVKLSTCWRKAESNVEFHGRFVDARWETPVKSEWANSVKAEITDHKPVLLWAKMLRKQLFLREILCRPRECFILYSYLFWRRNPRRCCQAISQLLILSPSSDTPLSKWHQHETEMNATGQAARIKAPVRDEGCRMLRWICPVALNEVIYFSSSPSASKQEASTRALGHARRLVALWLNHWG